MKFTKKITSYILCIITLFCVFVPTAYGEGETLFICDNRGDKAVIYGVVSDGQSQLTVPCELEGKSVAIQSLVPVSAEKFNGNSNDLSNLKFSETDYSTVKIILDTGVEILFENENIFTDFINLESVETEGNGDYFTKDGVLFNDKTLVCYPRGKKDFKYITPSEIEVLSGNGFYGNRYLTVAETNNRCYKISDNRSPFAECTNLTEIKSHGSMSNGFYVLDGILYNGNKLIHCPAKNTRISVTVPENITSSCKDSINNSRIEEITLTNNVTFGTDPYLPSLKKVNIGAYKGKKATNYKACAANINRFLSRCGSKNIDTINVDTDNAVFCEINNVLYNFSVTEILYYPLGVNQKIFTVPDTVRNVYGGKFTYFNIDGQNIYLPKLNTEIHLTDTQFNSMIVKKGESQVAFSVFNAVCSKTLKKYIDSATVSKNKARDSITDNLYFLMNRFSTGNVESLLAIYNSSNGLTEKEINLFKQLADLNSYYGLTNIYDYINYFAYMYAYSFEICSGNHTVNQSPIQNMTKNGKVIKGNPETGRKTYDYGTNITFSATVPKDGTVQWFINDEPKGEGATFTVTKATESFTLKALSTNAKGSKVLDEEYVIINVSFKAKFVWFFKHLFNPKAYDVKQ